MFDQSYNQVSSPYDLGFQGMSEFAGDLLRNGYTVELRSKVIASWLNDSQYFGSTLFLGIAMHQTYSEADIDAIVAFVRKGGHIIVICEHDDVGANLTFQNRLLENFDLKAPNRNIVGVDSANEPTDWPHAYDLKRDLRPKVYAATHIESVRSQAIPLLSASKTSIENKTIAALMKFGNGTVTVVGDSEIFWNMDLREGYRFGENAAFINQVILGHSQNGTPRKLKTVNSGSSEASREPNDSKTYQIIRFDDNNSFCGPEQNENGISSLRADLKANGFILKSARESPAPRRGALTLICNPIRVDLAAAAKGKDSKLILILDGMSSLEEDAAWQDQLRLRDIQVSKTKTESWSVFLKSYGIMMPFLTLRQEMVGTFHLSGAISTPEGETTVPLHRAGFVLFDNTSSAFTPFVRASCCPRPVRSMLETVSPQRQTLVRNFGRRIISGYTSQIFVIADYELISDESYSTVGKLVTTEIINWLKTDRDKNSKF